MSRLDRVRVQLGQELVELPWDSRQALLARLRGVEAAAPIVAAFEAVGTSRPVTFKPEDKPVLLGVVEAWLELAGRRCEPAGGHLRAAGRAPRRPGPTRANTL